MDADLHAPTESPQQLRYRPEIEGLRAVAVCAVILYHAGVTWFSGGYLGVDIFFVISGFLITGIAMRDLAAGRFAVRHFYERRIRRILPALLAMLALITPAACAAMLPDDLENFGQSLVATLFFSNNILLMLTSGYFELEASFKPLMHTWSLGVEEQYYLLAPLLLAASFRIGGRNAVFRLLAVITIAGLAFCIWAFAAAPVADFLLLPSRAWELGIGSLAYLWEENAASNPPSKSRFAKAFASAGLLLITLPLLLFGARQSAPGWLTLLPVLGTALILLFATGANGPGRLLALRPFVAIGAMSYSAYLYHQPVFAFARITSLQEPSVASMLALIPVIFLLAWLSWKFVERPFRDARSTSFRTVAKAVIPASVILSAVGLAMHVTSGLYFLRPELMTKDSNFGAGQNISYNFKPFIYLNRRFDLTSRKVKILVIGNSFARDFINAGNENRQFDKAQLSYFNLYDCDAEPQDPALSDGIAQADFIILASGGNPECTPRRLRKFRTATKARLIVIGTKNFGWNNNAVMLLPGARRYSFHTVPLAKVVAIDRANAKKMGPSVYVDVLAMISDKNGKVPVFTPEEKFISQDRSHLTKAGATYIGSIIFQNPLLKGMVEEENLRSGG